MKLAIVKHLDERHSTRAIADKFNVSKRIVQAAKENRDLILKEAENNRSLSKTKIIKQSNVNVILWRGFATARARGYLISGPILQGRLSKLLANWELKVVTSQLRKGGCRNGNNVTMSDRKRLAENLEMSTLSALNNGNHL